jgi:hypothetical protein
VEPLKAHLGKTYRERFGIEAVGFATVATGGASVVE